MPSPFVTVPQLALRLQAPEWLVRKLVDELDAGRCQRVGFLVRLVPPDLAEEVRLAIDRRGAAKGEAQHA